MQVAEGLQRDIADRALRHAGEDAVAQFGEQLGRDARQAIGDEQPDGHGDGDGRCGRAGLAQARRQGIDHGLKQNGDIDVGQLGDDQAADRRPHARAQVPADAGPQMRQQILDRLPLAHALSAALGIRLNCHG